MRKTEVREAVDRHMAELGYSRAWYAWPKPGRLDVYNGKEFTKTTYRIPAGSKTNKTRLAELLAPIPRCGVPREYMALVAKDDGGGKQAEMFGDRR
jgi:hypothetical protein